MSILAALTHAYDRMADKGLVPALGYADANISYVIALNPDGSVAGKPRDIRDLSGKKPTPRQMQVPAGLKRTSGVAANFLWDKTAYTLGVSAGEGRRLAEEHAAFVALHREALEGTADEGLLALRRFLEQWKPESFEERGWPAEMLDQNVVFVLESERFERFLHDRPAARQVWARLQSSGDGEARRCLVTGEVGPIARLHPAIKNVWGAQSSGASLVSFNLDAFSSYGHEQGDNAQISETAAFAYGAVLNQLLKKGSRQRLQIADASTVFWADSSNATIAKVAEDAFAGLFAGGGDEDETEDEGAALPDEAMQAAKLRPILEQIRAGKPLRALDPELAEGVRFHVLALAPNAARLAVRLWIDNNFGEIADNYGRFLSDIKVEPGPRNPEIGLWGYLLETAVLRKRENIPPNLAGAWLRAILAGTPYPLTLLSTVLVRIRADGTVNAERVGMLKAVLIRTLHKEDAPVALDETYADKGYLLGRLFAAYERAQTDALGKKVNATIVDKFFAGASAHPARVYPVLIKGAKAHLSKLRKDEGRDKYLEKLIGEIMGKMSPQDDPFPSTLSSAQQALFALGYYHQRQAFFVSHDKTDAAIDATATTETQS